MAFHPAFSRLENAEALILMNCARHDRRLLANDTFADDFCIDALANRIVDQPAAGQQLCRQLTDVLDADEVRKHVVALRWLRMIAQIDGSHGDSNSVCLLVEKAARAHDRAVRSRELSLQRSVGAIRKLLCNAIVPS